MLKDLFFTQGGIRNNSGVDSFTIHGVGYTECSCPCDTGEFEKNMVNLRRGNFFTAAINEFLEASQKCEISVLVDLPEIPGTEKTISKQRSSLHLCRSASIQVWRTVLRARSETLPSEKNARGIDGTAYWLHGVCRHFATLSASISAAKARWSASRRRRQTSRAMFI